MSRTEPDPVHGPKRVELEERRARRRLLWLRALELLLAFGPPAAMGVAVGAWAGRWEAGLLLASAMVWWDTRTPAAPRGGEVATGDRRPKA